MSLFQDLLKSGETLFRDTVWLSYDFQPKILFGREAEQRQFASAIKPLLEGRTGRNLFVYGAPGIGKTTACKHVLRELEETTDEVIPLYINCWKENTTYKVFYKICFDLGFKFIQQAKTTDLLHMIKQKLNKSSVSSVNKGGSSSGTTTTTTSAVFIFDEIDKLEEYDFLYSVLEDIYRKSVMVITNYRDSYAELDERVRSRFSPEFLYFRPYTEAEIAAILKQRRDYAFVPGCWDEEAFTEIVEKCLELKDIRAGLYLMQETGNIAEEKSSRRITLQHVADASKKVEDFTVKSKAELDEELQHLLALVKQQSGKKIGDMYDVYAGEGGILSYKSFQRRLQKLEEGKFIAFEKQHSKEGSTTIVNYEKKLTEF